MPKTIRSTGDSGNKIYFLQLTLSWKITIVSEERIGAIKGREGGIGGDRGGETSWREGQVGGASTPLLLYYIKSVRQRRAKSERAATWGSKHARLSSIIQPAGGGEADATERDRTETAAAGLAASPSESVRPPPSLHSLSRLPPAAAIRSISRKAPYYCAYNKSLLHCPPPPQSLSSSLYVTLSQTTSMTDNGLPPLAVGQG